jgi:L-gulonate 5-dehydrogenase
VAKLAKLRGAQVMVTDIVDDKLDYVKKQGADFVVNTAKAKLEDAVMDWTEGEGANKVIDAAATIATCEACFRVVSVAGTIVFLRLSAGMAQIEPLQITKKQLSVVGSRMNTRQFDNVIRMMESGMLQGNGMVTQKYKFANIKEAFEYISAHPELVRKCVLEF